METKQHIRLELQRFHRHIQNVLAQPTDHMECKNILQTLNYLSCSNGNQKFPVNLSLHDISEDEITFAKDEFQHHYCPLVLEFIVKQFTVEWMSTITKFQGSSKLIDTLFLEGPIHSVLIVLGESVSNTRVGYCVNKCTDLLEQLLKLRLSELLWNQSRVTKSYHEGKPHWLNLILLLATLPDRVTAKQGNQTSSFFYPAHYLPHVCQCIYQCLSNVHDHIQQGNSCSLEFLGQLIGKLSITGYKDALWEDILPRLEFHVHSDAIWCRLCERLINNVPDRCLESTIVPLIEQAAWYGTLVKFLADSVLTNQKLRFLLTTKLLLIRHYSKDKVLQNILGYLSHSDTTKHLLVKSLDTLLDVWGDASALRHTSYEQHLYISKAIIICLAFVEKDQAVALKQECVPKLMTGMQCHLESALPRVRRLGMVVAECLTGSLDPGGDKLTFNYDSDEETNQLKKLLTKPEDPGVNHDIRMQHASTNSTAAENEISSSVKNIQLTTNDEEELDSDDDLEPYDMSDDIKTAKVKVPLYLRDCLEGLISSDEPDRLEVCINSAESLVYKHAASVCEISVEFTKVLLHLQDNYAIPGFLAARHKAMVALACVSPAKVAEYLTKEFYERNYNIRQRIDVLEVLSAAAQKLSNPQNDVTSKASSSGNSLIQEVVTEESQPETWRNIVDKRIQSKTRYFSKGRQVAAPSEIANKFAPVAGFFFFPLLQVFEKRDGMFDLLGDDHLLLSRLCYTLGVILYAALHAPLVRQMSKALMEFIWTLRYHPQPAVRQGLLFAMSMLLLATPSHMLFTDLRAQMIDAKTWLQDVIDNDADGDCKQLAVQTIVLLGNALKQEFGATEQVT